MAIVALKLVSGEELVVDVSSETKTSIEFTNPVATVMQRRQEGPVLGFMPWKQSSKGPLVVRKDKIVRISKLINKNIMIEWNSEIWSC
jgi:hypothetical protein